MDGQLRPSQRVEAERRLEGRARRAEEEREGTHGHRFSGRAVMRGRPCLELEREHGGEKTESRLGADRPPVRGANRTRGRDRRQAQRRI